jgi:hypothetical protein
VRLTGAPRQHAVWKTDLRKSARRSHVFRGRGKSPPAGVKIAEKPREKGGE